MAALRIFFLVSILITSPFEKGEAVKNFINPRGGLVKRIFLIDLRDSIGYE